MVGASLLMIAALLLTSCGSHAPNPYDEDLPQGPPWMIIVNDGSRVWYHCVSKSGLETASWVESLDLPPSSASVTFAENVSEGDARAVLDCVLDQTDGSVATNLP